MSEPQKKHSAGRGGAGGASGRSVRGRRRGTGRAVVTLSEGQQWAPAGFGNRARVLVGPGGRFLLRACFAGRGLAEG